MFLLLLLTIVVVVIFLFFLFLVFIFFFKAKVVGWGCRILIVRRGWCSFSKAEAIDRGGGDILVLRRGRAQRGCRLQMMVLSAKLWHNHAL